MKTVKIEAQKRTKFGKEQVTKLRAQGLIPAEVYGKDLKQNESLLVDYKTLSQHLIKGKMTKNTIFSFDVEGKTLNVIAYEVQVHPISKKILHIDFKTVNEKEKVRIKLMVVAKGNSKGVKKGGRLQQKVDQVQVMILPQEIIPQVDVDITNLDIKEQILIKDLVLPPSVEVLKFPAAQQVFFIKG